MNASYHGIPGAITVSFNLGELPLASRIDILNRLARELGVWDAITAQPNSAAILAAIDAAWGKALAEAAAPTIGSELGAPLSDGSANLNAIKRG